MNNREDSEWTVDQVLKSVAKMPNYFKTKEEYDKFRKEIMDFSEFVEKGQAFKLKDKND